MKLNKHVYIQQPWFWGIILVIFSLSLRLIYFFQFKKTFYFDHLQLDPRYYWEWGGRIANGEILGSGTFDASPLYPYLMGLFRYIFGARLAPLYLFQICLGTVTVLLVFSLGKKLFGLKTGILAGFIMAAYKPEIMYNSSAIKPSLTAFMMVGMAYLLINKQNIRSLLGAGILMGLIAINDSHNIIVTPFILIWMMANLSKETKYRKIFAYLLGMIIAFSPIIMRNYLVSREFTLVRAGGGYVFYIGSVPSFKGEYRSPEFVRANVFVELHDFHDEAKRRTNNPNLTIKEASNFWYKEGLRLIKEQPLVYMKNVLRRFMIYWNAYEFPDAYNYQFLKTMVPLLGWWLLDFALLGSLGLWGMGLVTYQKRRLDLLALIIIGCSVSLLPFKVFSRLRFAMMPILAVTAAAGIVQCQQFLKKQAKKDIAVAAVILLLSATLVNWPLRFEKEVHFANAYTNLGLNYQNNGQPLIAMEKYLMAIRTNQFYVEAQDALKSLEQEESFRRLPDGPARLEKALDEVANIFLAEADKQLENGNYSDALLRYKFSINYRLDNFEAFLGAGKTAYHQKNYQDAFLYLKKAKEMKPKNPALNQFIAETYQTISANLKK